ncbi:hypothetical protein BKA93DRAFT_758484 [Sparassis latifolia]|uniref:Vacuolar ATPase assembly integral membrane protein vma-21 n=1 Tax=Sparassis crispa TaxID=139825 RepID=A0A401GC20_9APHY|nr:Vacuolar ATPase assembly integral membrane protein vma-21 [Sparassis crispa]GBE79736.1 Vacuolar ATPase assembly integral membrane protein vma-21 [Sparassis crispa]
MSEQVAVEKVSAQAAQQGGVLIKLILFSLSLAVAPLSAYFLSKDYLWAGNATYAAITAVAAANVVLVAYIIMSVLEESQAGPSVTTVESKKTR